MDHDHSHHDHHNMMPEQPDIASTGQPDIDHSLHHHMDGDAHSNPMHTMVHHMMSMSVGDFEFLFESKTPF